MPYTYLMTNRSRTLYTGTARDLRTRVWEHKTGHYEGSFTDRYHLDRLVFYERFATYLNAINREKQIKGMTRLKKMALIVAQNPTWADLSEGWYDRHQFQPDKPADHKRRLVPRAATAKKQNA
jgi:putative endonuclease